MTIQAIYSPTGETGLAMPEDQAWAELDILDRVARENLEGAKAENTARAYRQQWRAFTRWCAMYRLDPLPASPPDLIRYLNWMDLEEKSLSTVRSARSAVGGAHELLGFSGDRNPAKNPLVKETIRSIARRAGPQKQAQALLPGDLRAIQVSALVPRSRGRSGRPETEAQARRRGTTDIALCLTLRDAGLRRSEAADLTWSNLERWPDGSGRINILKSKTNRGSDPETVAITPATMAALENIRPERHRPDGAIFKLSARQIARRVAAAAKHAGLGDGFSGHSGRVGLARNMTGNGAPIIVTMKQGRWKNAETVARYTRGETAGEALRWIG